MKKSIDRFVSIVYCVSMLVHVQARIEESERDAVQAVAERQKWSFSQAAREVLRIGIQTIQRDAVQSAQMKGRRESI
jgi:hypothetical protein